MAPLFESFKCTDLIQFYLQLIFLLVLNVILFVSFQEAVNKAHLSIKLAMNVCERYVEMKILNIHPKIDCTNHSFYDLLFIIVTPLTVLRLMNCYGN